MLLPDVIKHTPKPDNEENQRHRILLVIGRLNQSDGTDSKNCLDLRHEIVRTSDNGTLK